MSREAELLELVLERNPFQRSRLEHLGLAGPPRLADLPPLAKRDLVEDQARHPQFGGGACCCAGRHRTQSSG